MTRLAPRRGAPPNRADATYASARLAPPLSAAKRCNKQSVATATPLSPSTTQQLSRDSDTWRSY